MMFGCSWWAGAGCPAVCRDILAYPRYGHTTAHTQQFWIALQQGVWGLVWNARGFASLQQHQLKAAAGLLALAGDQARHPIYITAIALEPPC
jgi:hypothetical protein